MIHYRKIGGLHFVSCGAYGFSFHRKRNAVRVARLSPSMVAGAVVGAVALCLLATLPAALGYARREGSHARWMLTHTTGRSIYIDDFNLTFDDCMTARTNGQRCRLQPKGVGQ